MGWIAGAKKWRALIRREGASKGRVPARNCVQNLSKKAGKTGHGRGRGWTRQLCNSACRFKNLGMTPVCPVRYPVLRIRRSGVQLPPGALQAAGISRNRLVSGVSPVSVKHQIPLPEYKISLAELS